MVFSLPVFVLRNTKKMKTTTGTMHLSRSSDGEGVERERMTLIKGMQRQKLLGLRLGCMS